MLGKTVYFCDLMDRVVREGVVLSRIISQSGYVVSVVRSNIKKHNVESKLIFKSKELAEEKLPVFLEIKDKMDSLEKAHEIKMESLRKKVIGKPEFKEVADEFFTK